MGKGRRQNPDMQNKNFNFSHKLGQHFLVDGEVCPRIAGYCDDKALGILEIGPGAGALTKELAKVAKKVAAVEIDTRLKADLDKVQRDYPNVTVVYGDIMQLDLLDFIKEHFGDCEKVAVCANLPYYITSPVIMKLLEAKLPVCHITVMVQKEAAERICAPIPSRQCGAVTYAVKYYCDSEILFDVNRTAFYPVPEVDSCVIRLIPRPAPPIEIADSKAFFSTVKAGFSQRRKTLLNSLCSGLAKDKADIAAAMEKAGIPISARMEELTFEQTAQLACLANPSHQNGLL